jgi:hypothetical protein
VLRSVLAATGIRDLPPGWGATTHASSTIAVRAGLRASRDDLQDLFAAPLLADAGLVEARVVRGALLAAAQGELLPLDGLAELVSMELWLRRLLARRGSCWSGAQAPQAPLRLAHHPGAREVFAPSLTDTREQVEGIPPGSRATAVDGG